MATKTIRGPAERILERAKARREGRRPWSEDDEGPQAPVIEQPDVIREGIEDGSLLLDDFPVSEKKDDVLTTATETSWREAGPSDLDAIRCKEIGEKFIGPKQALAIEKSRPKDPKIEEGYNNAMRDLARAARDAAREAEVDGPVNRAQRLPPQGSELMSETVDDERIHPGVPVAGGRGIPSGEDDAPAHVVRNLTDDVVRQIEGGVRRTPAPE